MSRRAMAGKPSPIRWCVPHGDGQTIRVRRWSADDASAAQAAAVAGLADRFRSGRPEPCVWLGEDTPKVLVVERVSATTGYDPSTTWLGDLSLDLDDEAVFYRWFRAEDVGTPRCLVMVRQPLERPEAGAARAWIDTVMAALGEGAPAGLISANFFVARDAGLALNLAEWTSAGAHLKALEPADFAEYGSIGQGDAWCAVREHPAITRDHEVSRYRVCARTYDRESGAR